MSAGQFLGCCQWRSRHILWLDLLLAVILPCMQHLTQHLPATAHANLTSLLLSQHPLLVAPAAAVAAPCCQAARLLRGRFDNEDDPSGYAAYNTARSISPLGTKSRSAYTPDAAESNANAAFIGECASSIEAVCCCRQPGLMQQQRSARCKIAPRITVAALCIWHSCLDC